jgi:hypothetical protein
MTARLNRRLVARALDRLPEELRAVIGGAICRAAAGAYRSGRTRPMLARSH